jgi:hypothetical protein
MNLATVKRILDRVFTKSENPDVFLPIARKERFLGYSRAASPPANTPDPAFVKVVTY